MHPGHAEYRRGNLLMSFKQPTGSGGGAWAIQSGWDVIGANGDKVGDVAEVYGNYFQIEKGFLFKTSLYVPFTAVTDVKRERVYLNISKDDIENQGWDQMPQGGTGYDYGTTSTATTRGAAATGTAAFDRTDQHADRTIESDRMEVPVAEEELQVRNRAAEQGRVHVRKDVVEDEQTLNVPVREEEVHVKRHRVDDRSSGDVPADAFREEDIEIPVYGEEVDVTKKPVVREEVEISKTAREREKRVTGKARRTDVRVDGEKTEPINRDRDIDRGTHPH
jgi:uncharacterized protein (TIGR02271 family)